MKYSLRKTLGLAFMFLLAFTIPTYGADDVPRIITEQLKDILNTPGLVLLDVRTEKDWGEGDTKIAGAVRVDPDGVDSWAGNYAKDQKIILYCA